MAVHLVGVSLPRDITIVVAVVLIGFLIIRRPERAGAWIKSIFEMVADIAGFWSPRSVPLAGASYRAILLEGIDSAIEQADKDPVTLVGHSQGSVVCAWCMFSLRGPQPRITLFTCGSPLWSLYAAFFPTYFGRALFQRVAANSARPGVVQLLATDRPDRDGAALRARRRRDRASLGTPSRSQRVLA